MQQDSEEEMFLLDLDKNYQCFTFTNQDGNTIYLYDRIRDDN